MKFLDRFYPAPYADLAKPIIRDLPEPKRSVEEKVTESMRAALGDALERRLILMAEIKTRVQEVKGLERIIAALTPACRAIALHTTPADEVSDEDFEAALLDADELKDWPTVEDAA